MRLLVRRNIVGRHLVVGRHSVVWRNMMRRDMVVVDRMVWRDVVGGSVCLVLVARIRLQVGWTWFLWLVNVHVW